MTDAHDTAELSAEARHRSDVGDDLRAGPEVSPGEPSGSPHLAQLLRAPSPPVDARALRSLGARAGNAATAAYVQRLRGPGQAAETAPPVQRAAAVQRDAAQLADKGTDAYNAAAAASDIPGVSPEGLIAELKGFAQQPRAKSLVSARDTKKWHLGQRSRDLPLTGLPFAASAGVGASMDAWAALTDGFTSQWTRTAAPAGTPGSAVIDTVAGDGQAHGTGTVTGSVYAFAGVGVEGIARIALRIGGTVTGTGKLDAAGQIMLSRTGDPLAVTWGDWDGGLKARMTLDLAATLSASASVHYEVLFASGDKELFNVGNLSLGQLKVTADLTAAPRLGGTSLSVVSIELESAPASVKAVSTGKVAATAESKAEAQQAMAQNGTAPAPADAPAAGGAPDAPAASVQTTPLHAPPVQRDAAEEKDGPAAAPAPAPAAAPATSAPADGGGGAPVAAGGGSPLPAPGDPPEVSAAQAARTAVAALAAAGNVVAQGEDPAPPS